MGNEEFLKNSFEKPSFANGLEMMPVGALIFKRESPHDIIYANRAFLDLYECGSLDELMELTGGTFSGSILEDDRDNTVDSIHKKLTEREDRDQSVHFYYRILSKNRIIKYLEIYGRLMNEEEGKSMVYMFAIESIISKNPFNTDELTGLPDKKHFMEYTDNVLKANRESAKPVAYSFIYFNLTNFKFFNIRYGMTEGDVMLKRLSRMLRKEFPNSYICRFSEDHFVSFTRTEGLLEKLENLKKSFYTKHRNRLMEIKAGIYNMEDNNVTPAVACDLAKYACDYIKGDGNSLYYIYESGIELRNELENYLVENLDSAMEKGHIKVFYQPVVRALTGAVCGLEALTRWIDPEKGFLSPGDFIPILEKRGLIYKLDIYVVNQVCRDSRERFDEGGTVVPVSFNLSRADFALCDPYTEVEKAARKYNIPREFLRVEITESTLMDNPDRIRLAMDKFHESGYQVWMDDFGSGYSSLNVLKDFNFDEIKIDMLFLRKFDERSRNILTHSVMMAKKLGIETLAEGVETKEQFEFLRSIGCQKCQGYYFGKPMPKSDMRVFITNSRLGEETVKDNAYFSEAGKMNFIKDAPYCLIEFDGNSCRHYYVTDGYMESLKSMGITSIEMAEESINDSHSAMYGTYRQFFEKASRSSEEMDVTFTSSKGQVMRVICRKVAHLENRFMLDMTLENLHLKERNDKQQAINAYVRSLAMLYDVALILHLKEDYVEELLNYGSFSNFGNRIDGINTMRQRFSDLVISSEDYERYMAFTDPATIVERVRAAERGYIKEEFRQIRRQDGSYEWKTFIIFIMPNSNGEIAILFTRTAASTSTKEMGPSVIEKNDLWDTLIKNTSMKFFWKDSSAKFVGASKAFVDFCNVDSYHEIDGKTSEDLGWSLKGSEDLANYENDVLVSGRSFKNVRIDSLVNGSYRKIIASKYPVFENGKIVGLLGLVDEDDSLDRSVGTHIKSDSIDMATGLMNSKAALEAEKGLDENYHSHNQDYAISRIDVMNFEALHDMYGEDFGLELLSEIGKRIQVHRSFSSVAARLSLGRFVVYSDSSDHSFIKDKAIEISYAIEDIREVSGKKIELDVDMVMGFASEASTLNDLKELLEDRLRQNRNDGAQVINVADDVSGIDFSSDIPVPFAVCKAIMDEQGDDILDARVLYANKALSEAGIFSRSDLIGRSLRDLYEETEVNWVQFCYESAIQGKRLKGRLYSKAINHWLDYIVYPTRMPGCCTFVLMKADDEAKKDRDLNRDFHTDDSILKVALILNSNDEYNSIMEKALVELSHEIHPERLYVYELIGDRLTNTFEWCAEGVEPRKHLIQNIPASEFSIRFGMLNYDTCVYIPSVKALKDTKPDLYEKLSARRIKRQIIAPLYNDNKLIGFLGANNYEESSIIDTRKILVSLSNFIAFRIVNNQLIGKMDQMGKRDTLTGAYNRIALDEKADLLIEKHTSIGVVFTDLNALKQTNDTFGHGEGDKHLRAAASLLSSVYGERNVFRVGGDEFIVLLVGITHDRFDKMNEELDVALRTSSEVTLAKGFEWCSDSADIRNVIDRADEKMYINKASYYGEKKYSRKR